MATKFVACEKFCQRNCGRRRLDCGARQGTLRCGDAWTAVGGPAQRAGRRRRKKPFYQTLFNQKVSQDRERLVKGLLVASRPGPRCAWAGPPNSSAPTIFVRDRLNFLDCCR